MMEMKLNGGPELLALMDQLPRKIGRNAVRGGVRAGAGVIRDQAKQNVRKRSGRLARAIKLSSRVQGSVISAKVIVRGAHDYIAPWLEYGVKAHWIVVAGGELDIVRSKIRSRKRGSTKTRTRDLNNMVRDGSLVINGNFVGPYVYHPGHPAYPFLRPALDTKAAEAINVCGQYIAQRLSWGSLQAPALAVTEEFEP
ncbi:HK97-gp10 family putative phage morphogenesis protein [Sphingomonas colocasiae]|uniref:HK97 gp10 family phage protein n=1 Tax=Sphingomonas colocasiae TaxID=1848973 RepID=A0ABS7PXN7_9SPHN|nr:HK97-gp10 family putative phage morphogenesis protein [Sphingomonas colocasiae]MBY8826118.1 HK97 gp10 family phage protein [Sphingomonas colocasiae]